MTGTMWPEKIKIRATHLGAVPIVTRSTAEMALNYLSDIRTSKGKVDDQEKASNVVKENESERDKERLNMEMKLGGRESGEKLKFQWKLWKEVEDRNTVKKQILIDSCPTQLNMYRLHQGIRLI